ITLPYTLAADPTKPILVVAADSNQFIGQTDETTNAQILQPSARPTDVLQNVEPQPLQDQLGTILSKTTDIDLELNRAFLPFTVSPPTGTGVLCQATSGIGTVTGLLLVDNIPILPVSFAGAQLFPSRRGGPPAAPS